MNIATYYILLKCKKCGKIIGKLISDDRIPTNHDADDDSAITANEIVIYKTNFIINCTDCVGE